VGSGPEGQEEAGRVDAERLGLEGPGAREAGASDSAEAAREAAR